MAGYIEKNVAIARLTALEIGNPCATITDAKRKIADTRPADVAPVVHGEWLLRHEGYGHYWECSVCHTNPCIYVTEHTKFCPNCGAKMDGGDNGEVD